MARAQWNSAIFAKITFAYQLKFQLFNPKKTKISHLIKKFNFEFFFNLSSCKLCLLIKTLPVQEKCEIYVNCTTRNIISSHTTKGSIIVIRENLAQFKVLKLPQSYHCNLLFDIFQMAQFLTITGGVKGFSFGLQKKREVSNKELPLPEMLEE